MKGRRAMKHRRRCTKIGSTKWELTNVQSVTFQLKRTVDAATCRVSAATTDGVGSAGLL